MAAMKNRPRIFLFTCSTNMQPALLPTASSTPVFLGFGSTEGRNILKVGFEQAWKHCQELDHCLYCHEPCFIEYNALLNLKPHMVMSLVSKLLARNFFRKNTAILGPDVFIAKPGSIAVPHGVVACSFSGADFPGFNTFDLFLFV